MSKRSGERCKRWAIPGGRTCVMHGSGTKAARAAGQRQIELHRAGQVAARLGIPVTIGPHEALLSAVHESAGVVAYWRAFIEELAPAVGGGMVAVDDPNGWEPGATRLEWREGVAGPDHLGDARLHIAVQAYNDARDALVRHARAAVTAGVEASLVRIRADEIQLVGNALLRVARRLLPDLDESEVRRLLGAELRALEARARVVDVDGSEVEV